MHWFIKLSWGSGSIQDPTLQLFPEFSSIASLLNVVMNQKYFSLIAAFMVFAQTGNAQNKASKWLAPTTFNAQEFLQPQKQYAPFTRWWWPGNDVNKEELKREMHLFADNHFGGVEIQSMGLIMPCKGKGRADRIMSFDTPLYYANLGSVMDVAKQLGLTVDLTDGSGWPSGGAHLTEEDNNLTLEYGMVDVAPNTKKPIKLPRASKGDRPAAQMVAVIAAKATDDKGPTVWLDDKSVVDLTTQVKDSCVTFNKKDANWKIITFWKMADMEAPMLMAARNSGFAMNHFDSLKVFKNYDHWLGERTGLKKYMGNPLRCLFNDSYEFRADRHFTDDFIENFKKNRGYNPVPYFPANIWYGYNNMYLRADKPDVKPSFGFSANDWRLRYDYDLTISDLLKEHMLLASKNYLEPKGMLHRTQAYGLNMDMMSMAGAASIPEMETMQFTLNSEAGYKIISSGAHLYNRPIVSCETAVYINRVFLTTPEKLRMTIDKVLVSGVNQIIYHGTPYSYFPDGYPKEGWYPFYNSALGVNFSTMLSETNPFWKYIGEINSYAQRAQYVLRSGKPQADVLIYYPFLKFSEGTRNPKELLCRGYLPDVEPALPEEGKPFDSKVETEWMEKIYPLIDQLNAHGVTWDWVNDESLQAITTQQGSLDVRGNKYQGLILFNLPYIQVGSAQNLKKVAEAGANIVCMGNLPTIQPSYKDFQKNDELTAALMKDVKNCASVKSMNASAELVSWIKNLEMPVRTSTPADMMRQIRRELAQGSIAQFYWNESNDWQNITLDIAPSFKHVYWMNAEDGSICEATISNQQVSKQFAPLSTAFLYCTQQPIDAVQKTAQMELDINKAEEVMTITHADIKVDSLSLENHPLGDWRNDDSLKYVGSEATYSFTVKMKKDKRSRYYMDLGKVCYSAEMEINGQSVGKRIYTPFLFDITDYIKKGNNLVTIRVTPSLYNELVKRGKDKQRLFKMFKNSTLASEGLAGPVKIFKYNNNNKK